jgi:hypothetical protein
MLRRKYLLGSNNVPCGEVWRDRFRGQADIIAYKHDGPRPFIFEARFDDA